MFVFSVRMYYRSFYISSFTHLIYGKCFYTMGDGMRQTLSYSDIKDMDVFVPSMEEQHRIVTFFQSFDKQISLQTLQLEKLGQMKKACLKKMIA